MTEKEIIVAMVKCLPILLAVWIFMYLLADEYLRALEARGLIRRPKGQEQKPASAAAAPAGAPALAAAAKGKEAAPEKPAK